jgi:hypothetical protein
LAAVCLLGATAIAHTSNEYQSKPTQSARGSRVVTSPAVAVEFDPSLAKVPPAFAGHDVVRLITVIRDRNKVAQKGEFETTEEYKKRLAQPHDTKLYGSLTERSTLAFVTGITQAEYDADTQRLRFLVDGAMKDHDKLVVRLVDNTKQREYQATNAFGAAVTVTELRGDRFGISVVNKGDTPGMRMFLRAPLDVQAAKAAKASAKALIVGTLADDLLDSTLLLNTPTRDVAVDSLVPSVYLKMNVQAIWLFDQPTGRVYHKEQLAP